MRALRVTLAILTCLGLVLATPALADHHELMQEVEELNDQLAAAMLAEDVDGMMSFYLEDAISLPNNGPRMDGVEAFRQAHEEMAASGMEILSFESQPTDVWEAGDQVIDIGTYEIEIDMGGTTVEDHGKYLTIWQRNDDGDLKVKVETWNTDVNPMEEMMGDGGHGHGEGHGHAHGDAENGGDDGDS